MAENNGTVFTFTVKASTDTTQLETLKKQLSSVQEDARKLSDSFTRVQGLESLTAGAEDFSKAIEHATYNIEKAQKAFSSGLTTKSERQEMLREIDRDVRDIQTRQAMLTSKDAGAGFSISGINDAVQGLSKGIQKEFAAVLPHLQTAIRNSISTENLRMNVLGGGFTASEIKSKDGGKVIKGQNGKVIASTADIGDLDQIVNMIMNPGVYSGGGLNESAGAVERDLLKKIQGANEAQRRQMLRLAVGSVINPMQSKEYRGTRASIEEAEIKAYQDELARARAKIRPEVEKEIQASNPGLVGDDFRKRVRDIVEKRANGEVQRIMTGYGLASRTRAGSHGYSKLEDGKTVFSANYSKQYETLKNISEAKEIDPIMMLPELFRPVFRSNGFSSFRSRAVDAAYRGKQVTNEAQVLTGRGLATLLQKMNNNAILEQAMVDSGIAHRTTSGDIMLPTEITKQQLFETLGESLTAQFVTHTKGLKHEIGETGVDRTKATRGAYGELEDYWSVFTDPNKSASIVGKMRAGTGARALNAMRAFQDIIMSSGEDNLWEIPNTPGTNVGDRLKKLAEYGYRVPRNTGSISVNAAYKAMAENPDLGFTEAGQRRAKNMYAVKKYDPFSAAIQALQGNLKVNGKQVTFDEVIAAIPKMLSGDTVIGSTMETINESQITDLLNFGLNRKGTPLVENYGDISGLVRQIDIAKLQTLADASELFGGNKSKAQDAANQVLHAIMSAYGTDGGTSTEWRGAAAHGFSESQVLRVINAKRAEEVNAEFQESVARAYSQATGTSIEEGRKYAAGRDIFRNLTNAKDRTYKNAKAQGKGFEALNKAWTDSYVIGNFETVARDEALKNAGLASTASNEELRAAGYRQSVIEDGKWTNSPTMALIDLARARKVYKMKDGVRIAFDPRIHKKEAQDLDNTTIVDPTSGTRFLADWKGFEATNGLGYADSRYLNSGAQIRGALGLKGSLQSVDTQGKTLAQWAYEQGIAIAMDRATGKQITGSVEDYIRTNTGANVGYFMQGFSGDLMSREKLESGSGRQGAMVDITNAQVLMDESLIKNMEIYKGLADDILTTKLAPFAGGRTDLKAYAQDLLARQSISKLEAGEQQAYEVAQEWANETARRGGELMSGLIELSPLRAATEYKHDKSNSAAIGGQMAKFLGLNPEFMAYQQAQSLARLQDLRTAGGARKYIFGDSEEDEFSREFNDEALGDAYMSANLGGIYERKKKEFMRSRSLAAGNAQIYNYDAQGINADGTRAFGAVGNIADKRLLDNLLTTSMIVAGTSTGGANALEQAREAGRYDEMTTFDQSSPAFQKVISRLKGYWGDTAVNETDVQRWLNLEGGLIDFEKQGYMVGTGARAPNGFGQYIGGINYAGVFNPVKSMFGSTQGLFVSNNYKGGMSGADMDADEAKMIYSNLYDVSRWGFDMGKEDQAYDTLNDDQKRARNMYMDMIRTLEGTGDSYIASSGNIDYKKLETNLAAFRQKYQKEIAHNFGLDKDTVQRTQEEIAARVRAGDTDTAAIGRLNDAEIAARIDAYSKQDLTSSMIRTLRQYDAIKMDAIKAGYDPLTLGLDFNERDLTPEQIAKAYGIDIRIKDDVATTIGGTNGKYKAIFANGKYNRGFVDDKGVERILKEGEEGYDDAVWKPDAKGKYGSGMFGSRLMQEVYMRRAAEAAMYMGRASDAGSRLSMLDLNDPINRIFARTAGGSNRLYDIYTTWQKKPSDVAEPKAISNALQLGNEYAKGINWINGSMARQLVGYYKDDEGNYIARELHDLANIQEIMQEEGRGQTNEGKKYTLDKIGAYSQASSGNLHPLGRDADEFTLNDASRDNLIGGRLMDVEEALGIRKENGQYTRNATRGVIKETSAGDFFYMGDLGGTLGNRNANGGYKIDALNLPSVYNPADLTGLMTRRNSMIAGLGDTTLALSLAETFDALDTGEFKEGGAAASLLKNMRYIKAGFMGGTRDIITDAEAEILLKQRYAAEAEIDRMVAEQKAAVEENAMMTGGSSKYGFKIKTGVDSEGKDTYHYGMTEQEYRRALMGNLGLNQVDLMLGTYKSPETGNYLETGMTYTNMAYRAFQNPNLAYRHTVGKFIDPIDNRSVNLLNEGTFEDSFGGPEDTRTQVVNMILDERNRRSRAIRAARNTMSEDQQQGLLDAYDNAPTIQVADDTFKVMQAANAEGARRRQKAYEEAMERKRQMNAYLESDTPIPEEYVDNTSSSAQKPTPKPAPKPAPEPAPKPVQRPTPTARRKPGLRYDSAEGAWMYSDEGGMERRVTPAFESTHYDEISEVFKDNPSLEKQMYPNGRPTNPRAPKPSPDTFYQKLDPVEEGIAAWHNYAGKGQYDPRKISTDVNQAYANPQNLIDAFSDIDRAYNAIFTGQQKFLTDNAPGLSQLDAAEQRLAANLSEESNVQAQRTIDSLADLRERRNAFRNLYTRADSTRTAMADAVISVAEQNTDSSEMQAIARNVGGGSNAQKAQEIVKKFGSVNAPGNTSDIISNINTALGDPYKAVVDAMTGKTDRDIVFWDTETTSTGTASNDKNQANIMQLSAAKYNAAKKQWETFNEFVTPQEYDKFNPATNPEFWLGDGTNKGITAINHITPDQVYGDQANSFKDTIGRFFQFIGVTDENGKVQDVSKLALLVGQNNIKYDNNVLFNALKRDPSILADLGIDQTTFEGMISGNSFDTLNMLTAMRNQRYTMSDGSSIGQRGVLDWIAQGNPIFGDTAITTGQTVKGFSKLGSIASLFGLPSEGAHDATFDSFMTAGVLGNLINIVSGDGTIQANQIDEIRNRLQGYVQAGQAVDEAAVQKNSTDFLNAWSTNYAINRAGLVRSSLDQDTREKILAFTKADAITEVLGGDGGIVSGYYASFDRESAYAKEVADRAREYIKNNGNLEEQYTAMDDSDPRKAALLDTLYSQWDVVRSGAYQQELVNIGRGMSEKDRNLLMTASSDTARLDEYANQADDSDTFRKAMNMRQDLENIYDHLNTIGIDASSGINTAFDEMYKNAQGFDPVARLRAAGANTPEAANLRRFQQDNADQFGLNHSGEGPSYIPPVDDYSNGGIWGDAGSEAGGVASLSATQVNISGSSINIAAETVNLATAQTNAASAQTVNIGDMINAMSDSINERYNEGRNAGVRSVTQVNENGTSSTNLNGTTFAQRLVLAGLDASTAAAIGQRAGEMVNRGSTIADNVFKPIDGASSFLLTSRKAINDLIRENRNAINPENISHSQTSQQMDNLKFLRGVSSRARSEANRASDAEQRRSLLSTVDAFDRLVAEQEGRIVQAGVAESMTTIRKTRATMDSALDKRPGEMQALITRSKNAEDAYRKSREDVAVLERIEADNQFAQHASAFDPNNRGGETNLIHQLRVSREHLAQMQHDRDIVTQEYDTSLQDIYSGMDLQYQESSKKGKPTNMFELRKQILAERKAANSNLHDLRSAAEHELSQWKLGGTRNAEGQSMEGRDSVTLADFLSGNWDRFGTGVDAATGVDADAQRDRMRVLRQQISTWQGRLDSLNGPQHGVIPTAGRRWQELYGNIDDNFANSISSLRKLAYGGRNEYAEAALARDENIRRYDTRIEELRSLANSTTDISDRAMYAQQEQQLRDLRTNYVNNSRAEMNENIISDIQSQSLKYGGTGLNANARNELLRAKAEREARATLEGLKDENTIRAMGGVNTTAYQEAVRAAVENLSRVVANTVVDSSLRVARDGSYTFATLGTRALTIDANNAYMDSLRNSDMKAQDSMYRQDLSLFAQMTKSGLTKEDEVGLKKSQYQASLQKAIDEYRSKYSISDTAVTNDLTMSTEAEAVYNSVGANNPMRRTFDLLRRMYTYLNGTTTTDANGNTITTPAEFDTIEGEITERERAANALLSKRNAIKATGGRMTDEERYSFGREQGALDANNAMRNFAKTQLTAGDYDQQTFALTAAGRATLAANPAAQAAYDAIMRQQAYFQQGPNGAPSAYDLELRLQDENRSRLMELQTAARIDQTNRSIDYYSRNNRLRAFGGGIFGQAMSQANMIRNQYENNINAYDRDVNRSLVNFRSLLGNSSAGNSIYDVMQDRLLSTNKDGSYQYTAAQLYTQAQAAGFNGSQVDFTRQLESIRAMRTEAERMRGTLNSWNGPASTFSAIITSAVTSINTAITRFTSQMLRKGWQELKKYTVEMDTAYAKIQAITMKSDGEMEGVKEYTISTAKELHTSASNVAKVEQELYRQGLSDSDVQSRTKTILQYSAVTGADITKSVKQLTTAVNTGLVDSLEKATDAMVALGDAAATTASEIAAGMQKSAASAKVAGVSFEELTAFITIGTSKTQLGGSQVGNMLSTSMQRYRKIAAGGYDNEDGTPSNANDVEKALHTVGLSIFKEGSLTEMKDYTTVMREIAGKWNQMNDVEKSQVTYAMAGTRQGNLFTTYMEALAEDNGALLNEYIEKASNSTGAVAEKYAIVTDTIQTKLTDIKNAFDDFATSLDTDGIKTILGGIGDVVSSFSNLGGVGGLAGLAGSLIGISTGLKALFTVFASHPIVGLIVGAGALVTTAIVSAVKKAKEAAEKAEEEAAEKEISRNNARITLAKNRENEIDTYLEKAVSYKKEYGTIEEAISKGEEESLIELINNVKKRFPELASSIDTTVDGVTGSFDKLISKLVELKTASNLSTKEMSAKAVREFNYAALKTELEDAQEGVFSFETIAENLNPNGLMLIATKTAQGEKIESGSVRSQGSITADSISGIYNGTEESKRNLALLMYEALLNENSTGWATGVYNEYSILMPEEDWESSNYASDIYGNTTWNKERVKTSMKGGAAGLSLYGEEEATDWNRISKTSGAMDAAAMYYAMAMGIVDIPEEMAIAMADSIAKYNTSANETTSLYLSKIFSSYLAEGGYAEWENFGITDTQMQKAFDDWSSENIDSLKELTPKEVIQAFIKSITGEDAEKVTVAGMQTAAATINEKYNTSPYFYQVKDEAGNVVKKIYSDTASAYDLGSAYYTSEIEETYKAIQNIDGLISQTDENSLMYPILLKGKENLSTNLANLLTKTTEEIEDLGYAMLESGQVRTNDAYEENAAKTMYSYYNPYSTSYTKRRLTNEFLGFVDKNDYTTYDELEKALNGDQKLLAKYGSLFQNENIANIIQDIKAGNKDLNDLIEALKGTIDVAANFKEINEKTKTLKSNKATAEVYQRIVAGTATTADYAAMESDLGYSIAGLTSSEITALANKGVSYYQDQNDQTARDLLNSAVDTIFNEIFLNGDSDKIRTIDVNRDWGTGEGDVGKILTELGYGDLAQSFLDQGIKGTIVYDSSLNEGKGGYKLTTVEYTGTSGASSKETFENAVAYTNTATETLNALSTIASFASAIANGSTYEEATRGFGESAFYALNSSGEAANIANLLNSDNTEEARGMAAALLTSTMSQMNQYLANGLKDQNVASWVTATTSEGRQNAVTSMKQVNQNLATNEDLYTKLKNGTITEEELGNLANYLGVDVSQIRGNATEANRLMQYKRDTAATQKAEYDAKAFTKMREEAEKLGVAFDNIDEKTAADLAHEIAENTSLAGTEAQRLAQEYLDVEGSIGKAKKKAESLNKAIGEAIDQIDLNDATKELDVFLKKASEADIASLYQGLTTGTMADGSAISESWQNVILNSSTALTILGNYSKELVDAKTAADQLAEALDKLAPKRSAESLDAYADAAIELLGTFTDEDTWKLGQSFMHNYLTNLSGNDAVGYAQLQERYPALFEMVQAGDWNAWQQAEASYTASREINTLTANDAFYGKSAEEFLGYISDYATAKAKNDTEGMNDAYQKMVAAYGEYSYYSRLTPTTWEEQQALLGYFGGNSYGDDVYTANKSAKATGMTEALSLAEKYLGDAATDFLIDYISYELGLGSNKVMTDAQSQAEFNNDLSDLWSDYYQEYLTKGYLPTIEGSPKYGKLVYTDFYKNTYLNDSLSVEDKASEAFKNTPGSRRFSEKAIDNLTFADAAYIEYSKGGITALKEYLNSEKKVEAFLSVYNEFGDLLAEDTSGLTTELETMKINKSVSNRNRLYFQRQKDLKKFSNEQYNQYIAVQDYLDLETDDQKGWVREQASEYATYSLGLEAYNKKQRGETLTPAEADYIKNAFGVDQFSSELSDIVNEKIAKFGYLKQALSDYADEAIWTSIENTANQITTGVKDQVGTEAAYDAEVAEQMRLERDRFWTAYANWANGKGTMPDINSYTYLKNDKATRDLLADQNKSTAEKVQAGLGETTYGTVFGTSGTGNVAKTEANALKINAAFAKYRAGQLTHDEFLSTVYDVTKSDPAAMAMYTKIYGNSIDNYLKVGAVDESTLGYDYRVSAATGNKYKYEQQFKNNKIGKKQYETYAAGIDYGLLPVTDLASRNDFQMQYVNELLGYKKQIEAYKAYEAAGKDLSKITDKQVLETLKSMGTTEAEITKSYNTSNANYSGVYQGLIDSIGEQAAKDINTRAYNAYNYYTQAALIEAEQENARQVTSVETYKKAWDKYKANNYIWNDDWYDETDFDMLTTDTEWLNAIYGATNQADRTANIKNLATKTTPQGISYGYTLADAQAALDFIAAGNYSAVTSEFDTKAGWKEFLTSVLGQNVMGLLEEGADQTYASAYINKAYSSIASTITQNLFDAGDISSTQKSMEEEYAGAINPEDTKVLVDKWAEASANAYYANAIYKRYKEKGIDSLSTKELEQFKSVVGVDIFNTEAGDKLDLKLAQVGYADSILNPTDLMTYNDAIVAKYGYLINGNKLTAEANAEVNLSRQKNRDAAIAAILAGYDETGVIPEINLVDYGLMDDTEFMDIIYDKVSTPAMIAKKLEGMTTEAINNGLGNQATVTMADMLFSYLEEYAKIGDKAALENARNIWNNTEGISKVFSDYYGDIDVTGLFTGEGATEASKGDRLKALTEGGRIRKYKEYEIMNQYGYITDDEYSMLQTAQEIEKIKDEDKRELAVNEQLQQWQEQQNTDAQALRAALNYEAVANSTTMTYQEKVQAAREYIGADENMKASEVISQAAKKAENDRAAAQANIDNIMWLFDALSGEEFADIRNSLFGDMTREEIQAAYGATPSTYLSAGEAAVAESAYGNTDYYQEKFYGILGSGGDRQDILSAVMNDTELYTWITTQGGEAATILEQLTNRQISVNEAFAKYSSILGKDSKAMATYIQGVAKLNKEIKNYQYYINKGAANLDTDEQDELAGFFGYKDAKEALGSGETVEGMIENLKIFQQQDLDSLTSTLQDEVGSAFRDATGNVVKVDGLNIEVGAPNIIAEDIDLSGLEALGFEKAMAERVAYLMSLGYDVQYVKESAFNPETGEVYERLVPTVVGLNNSGSAGQRSSSGGGGKSTADKLLEKWKNKIAVNQHRINMLDKTAEGYKNKGELTNYGKILSYKNDEMLALKAEYLQANEELEALYAKTSTGTKNSDKEDAIKLRDQIGAQSDYTEMYKITTALIAGNS